MRIPVLLAISIFSTVVLGDEIKILSGGAAKSFIDPLAAGFPGHSVKIEYQPMGRLTKSLAEGYPADMIVVTAEAFKRTLLAAKSAVYIDPKTGTSGKHVAQVFQRLNIVEEMKRKSTLGQGGYVTEPVGRGEIELGIHQISEILPVKVVKLAGPLPPELQKYTVYVAVNMKNSAIVKEFISHLGSAQAKVRLAQAGYTLPE